MDEQNIEATMTRRQVLIGGAAVAASVALASTASQAQPPNPVPNAKTKQVRVYVTDKELEDWTVDVIAAFDAGTMSLGELLHHVGAKTENEYLQKFSQDAPDILARGYLLSDLMEMNRHIFTHGYVTTVRYGEFYAELETALKKWVKDRPKGE